MTKYLLSSVVVLVVILGAAYFVYQHGYKNGSQDKDTLWRQQEAVLLQRIREVEARHSEQQQELAREAQQVQKQHEAAVAAQRDVYEQRLSQSSRRAEVYRAQAEAGTASSRDLAAHAALLDRTLEEGRGLVQELRTGLGFCEDRVRLLGQQLIIDRQLATEEL